jgi:uncharacterized paraquat-inducible protein A
MNGDEVVETMLSVLLQVPHIRHFSLRKWIAIEVYLICLSKICVNLTSLYIEIWPDNGYALLALNRLQNLRSLAVLILDVRDTWQPSPSDGFALETVVDLSWSVNGD